MDFARVFGREFYDQAKPERAFSCHARRRWLILKGSKKQVGPNKWSLHVELEQGIDGKRKQKHLHFTGTARQAEVELRRLLTAISDGSLVHGGRLNVADLMTRWLDSEQRSVSW